MGPQLIPAVQNGSISEARLDDQAIRLLTAWYKMGQDKGYPAVNYHGNTLDTYYNGTLGERPLRVDYPCYRRLNDTFLL